MIEKDIERAKRAELILNDDLIKEAREQIEAECWRLFKTLSPDDSEGLMQVKGIQYLNAKYWAFLQAVIQNGTLAKLELERKQPRPKGY
jgi:hypothetical protein